MIQVVSGIMSDFSDGILSADMDEICDAASG